MSLDQHKIFFWSDRVWMAKISEAETLSTSLLLFKSTQTEVWKQSCRISLQNTFLSRIKNKVCGVYKVYSNWLRPELLLKQWLSLPSWGLQSSDCLPLADNWPPTLYLIVRRKKKRRKNCKGKLIFLRYRDFCVLSCPELCLSLLLHHLWSCC